MGGVCFGGGEFSNRLGEQIDLCLRIILCCLELGDFPLFNLDVSSPVREAKSIFET